MPPKTTPPMAADREAFMASLALFDRPEAELRQRVLEDGDDVDAFVERAFAPANVTLPPF